LLVERGAWVAYAVKTDDGTAMVKNGLELAAGFPDICDWLLVQGFTDVKLLEGMMGDGIAVRHTAKWGGSWTVTYKPEGMYYKRPRELEESRIA